MIKISALKFKLKLSFTGIKHLHEIPTGSPPPCGAINTGGV